MSETEPKSTAVKTGPESQHQRWMKYGSNSVLLCIIVVLLGAIFPALAQLSAAKIRVDTTQAGVYSLKPQTKQILKDLKQDVEIVSLYTNVKPPADATKAQDFVDYAQPVADLLEEYKRYGGGKVTIQVIDPTQNPGKVDDLIARVTERYGGEVKAYRDFLDGYAGTGKTEDQIKKILTDEVKQASAISEQDLQAGNSKLAEVAQAALDTSKSLLRRIEETARTRKRQLDEKPPNYRQAVDGINSNAEDLSDAAGQLVKLFGQFKGDVRAPASVKKYAEGAEPRFKDLQTRADAVTAAVKKLGSLKLDDLRTQLKERDGIVVLGPKDMRTLSFEQVWQTDPNVRRELMNPDAKIKPRFAGEQQITSAILALTQEKKPKVVFVRPGGAPLTTPGSFFNAGGPLSQIAARLKEYNFDVLEKDLSGTWAMQAQMRGGPPPEPEPSDEDIKDAIWIVLSIPAGQSPMGAPPSIASKVKDHLDHGGSALCLFIQQGDNLEAALAEWGLKVRTDAVIVHQPVPTTGAQSNDIVQLAQHQPSIFVLNNYGDHVLAKPLTQHQLDTVMIQLCPVSTTSKAGYTASNLLPIPTDPKSWGETNIESANNPSDLTFDPKTDIPGPLYGGAAVEKDKGGRVVAIGSIQFAINDLLSYPDRDLLERGYLTPRFPGSAELFLNSVFWLAHMEPMIAISPSAMDVSRIQPMSDASQWFWRTGVLLIGLPLLVVLAGGLMYVRRRD